MLYSDAEIPKREMTAIGTAVAALLERTGGSDSQFDTLRLLKTKLLNRGSVAHLAAKDVQLAYLAVVQHKADLLARLSDRAAYASPETLQEYKENLFYMRQFELKVREGVYTRTDIANP